MKHRRAVRVCGAAVAVVVAVGYSRRRRRARRALWPIEVAGGVFSVNVGGPFGSTNVYLVAADSTWSLVDTGWANHSDVIRHAADSLFGANTRPTSILLTHIHPDHSGSASELAKGWNVAVYVHEDEVPLAAGTIVPGYENPLDRWLLAPVMRLLPPHLLASAQAAASLVDVVRPLGGGGRVPGLPGWEWIHTPGHTPGHVSYFRERDRVLISGDALLTVNINSMSDLLLRRYKLAGPPYVSTWSWPAAKTSVVTLARRSPDVLACGHGKLMAGPATARDVRVFAERFSGTSVA